LELLHKKLPYVAVANPASAFLFDRWKDSNLEKAASVKKNSLKRLFFSEAVRDGNRQSGRRAIKTQSGFVLSPRPKKQESVNPASAFLFDRWKDSNLEKGECKEKQPEAAVFQRGEAVRDGNRQSGVEQ